MAQDLELSLKFKTQMKEERLKGRRNEGFNALEYFFYCYPLSRRQILIFLPAKFCVTSYFLKIIPVPTGFLVLIGVADKP